MSSSLTPDTTNTDRATITRVHGEHHSHIRKRLYKNSEPFPHPRLWVRILDRVVYVAGFLGPAMTMPQLYLIYGTGDASGVSSLSWGAYMILNVPWILYGVVHKERVITFTYTLWFFVNGAVAFGALWY